MCLILHNVGDCSRSGRCQTIPGFLLQLTSLPSPLVSQLKFPMIVPVITVTQIGKFYSLRCRSLRFRNRGIKLALEVSSGDNVVDIFQLPIWRTTAPVPLSGSGLRRRSLAPDNITTCGKFLFGSNCGECTFLYSNAI